MATVSTNINEMRTQALRPREANMPEVTMGFGSLQSFELMQRCAKLLMTSTLVPTAYRAFDEKKGENPNALANCVVALNMSQRMGADALMVMQNLYIVEGRPSWSSQWIIAAINGCGRFSPLRFQLRDLGDKEVEYETTKWVNRERVTSKNKAVIQNRECVAWTVENGVSIPQFSLNDLKKHDGVYGCCKAFGVPIVESPMVSIEMAVKEGWYGKSGSKWQTMPEVMLRYRTASFFGKLYAPELLMGLQSVEEVRDVFETEKSEDGAYQVTSESLRKKEQRVDEATGEIIEEKTDEAGSWKPSPEEEEQIRQRELLESEKK